MQLEDFTVSDGGFSIKEFERQIISKKEDEKLKDEIYDEVLPRLIELHERLNAEGERGLVVVFTSPWCCRKRRTCKIYFIKSFSPRPKTYFFWQAYRWRKQPRLSMENG